MSTLLLVSVNSSTPNIFVSKSCQLETFFILFQSYSEPSLKKALTLHYVVRYNSVHFCRSKCNEESWTKRLFLVARLGWNCLLVQRLQMGLFYQPMTIRSTGGMIICREDSKCLGKNVPQWYLFLPTSHKYYTENQSGCGIGDKWRAAFWLKR